MRFRRSIKRRRNQELILYYKAHPEFSLAEVGEIFGISKQRVHQIVNNNNKEMTCFTCYHYKGSFCACRCVADMIRQPGKCSDWHPRDPKEE